MRAVRPDLAQLRVAAADLIFLHDPGLVNGTAVTAALWQGMQDALAAGLAYTREDLGATSLVLSADRGDGWRGWARRASEPRRRRRPPQGVLAVRTLSRTPRRGVIVLLIRALLSPV